MLFTTTVSGLAGGVSGQRESGAVNVRGVCRLSRTTGTGVRIVRTGTPDHGKGKPGKLLEFAPAQTRMTIDTVTPVCRMRVSVAETAPAPDATGLRDGFAGAGLRSLFRDGVRGHGGPFCSHRKTRRKREDARFVHTHAGHHEIRARPGRRIPARLARLPGPQNRVPPAEGILTTQYSREQGG